MGWVRELVEVEEVIGCIKELVEVDEIVFELKT